MFRFFVCGVAFFFCVVLCCCCVVLCFSFCVAFLFVGWCILQMLRTEYVQFWRAHESSEPECAFGVSNLPSRGGAAPRGSPPRAPLLPPKGPGTSPGSPRPPGKTLTCLLINYFMFGRVFSHFWPNGRTHRVGLSSDGQEQVSSNVCPLGFGCGSVCGCICVCICFCVCSCGCGCGCGCGHGCGCGRGCGGGCGCAYVLFFEWYFSVNKYSNKCRYGSILTCCEKAWSTQTCY